MIIRRRFRPLGKLLQRFGRGQINNYTQTSNMASRAEVPSVWEEDTQQPLVWQDPDVNNPPPADFGGDAAPAPVQRRASVQRSPQPAQAPTPGDSGPRRTPPDLLAIFKAHSQKQEEEGYVMPPSPWARPADSSSDSRQTPAQSSTAKPVQRRAQAPAAPDPTPVSRPANIPATPAPQTVSSRRRGRVIEETTPQIEGEEAPVSLPQASSAPTEEAPSWETELETAEDRPDLFEALMSEGVVQRRHDPDLSDAETFAPKFRPTPIETPAERPSPPTSSFASNAPAANTPNVQRSEAAQPPRSDRAAQTPPQTPIGIQGLAAPVQRQSDDASEYYADDEVDMPPSLIPASGTTEADLLDMLGLPPDTPVRGLNPAAAVPPSTTSPAQTSAPSTSTPSSTPAAPVQRQSAPPAVQRTESTSPAQSSTPANPTPPSGQRVNRPPRSNYPQQTSSAQPDSADIPASSAPTSLSNQTVMRQPQVPETQDNVVEEADEAVWSEEPPAVAGFTSFFEAAEAAQSENDWPENAPAEADMPDWSEPESPANEPPGESPRTNSFPMSNPPAAITSNAPTRPATPRVQRAEADLPYIDEDLLESFSDAEDTQPINLPFTSSAPTTQANSTPEASNPRSIQRAVVPSTEWSSEPDPYTDDLSFIEEEASSSEAMFWSDSDDVEPYSAEYTSQPSEITPSGSRPVSSSSTPSVQRAESSPPAASQPADSYSSAAPIGYHIEGLPEHRGSAPTGQVSRAKTGDKTMGGDKLGGKTVPEGMSMELPSKTTTDTVPGAVTAPSSGKTDGGSNIGGKAGSSPAIGGKTDPGAMPPPNTSSTTTLNTLPVDEAVAEPASSPSGGSDEGSEANPESAPGGQNDVDKLARDVYNLLRDRLRVEQERRPKR